MLGTELFGHVTPLDKTKHQSLPLPECFREPCCLGVDEAGRGPVLGPMVYGVAYCRLSQKDDLRQAGYNDSKQLSEQDRDSFYASIRACEWLGWEVAVLSPRDISRQMLRRHKYNLNALSHDTAIRLIRRALERGVNVQEVYVDTVGSPQKYQAMLERQFPGIKITVESKADAKYPVVSAASICAKVVRDQYLSRWRFTEPGLEQRVSKQFGSGYPGDPVTKQWLRDHLDRVFGYPSLIRFSWSTTVKLLDDLGCRVDWPADDDDQQQNENTAQAKQAAAAFFKKPQTHFLFKNLQVKSIKQFD
jgi:ribonuclease H2 subunit A